MPNAHGVPLQLWAERAEHHDFEPVEDPHDAERPIAPDAWHVLCITPSKVPWRALMPKFITIGYGDRAGYDRTARAVRDAAHANDATLRREGALVAVAGRYKCAIPMPTASKRVRARS